MCRERTFEARAGRVRRISVVIHGRRNATNDGVVFQFAVAALAICVWLSATASAQPVSSAADALSAAAQQQKYAFVMFWKQQDAATDAIFRSLDTHMADRKDRATTVAIKVTDPAHRDIVERFNVSRVPMPLVLAVAPNGAVTASYQSAPTAQQIASAFVTPASANCLKAVQDGKVAIMLIHPREDAQLPQGVKQFLADPDFKQRASFVRLVSSDPDEMQLLKKLDLSQQEANGCAVMMAPPGVFVGKFPLSVTGQELAKKLHASGKCCDDENCKHNRKTKE